jgi:ABC-type tungstate transport system permease subunit
MTYHPEDPAFRRELQREADQEGWTTAAWAGVAVALLLAGGVMAYMYLSDQGTTTAAGNQPTIQQPATTGQGSAQSRLPAKNAQ